MLGHQCFHPTHIVSISCLPQLSLLPVGSFGGGWSWTSILEVSCCISAALCLLNPGQLSEWGQPGVLVMLLLTRERSPAPVGEGLSSQGECSWTTLIYCMGKVRSRWAS